MKQRLTTLPILFCVMLLLVFAAGCGNNSDNSGSSNSGSATNSSASDAGSASNADTAGNSPASSGPRGEVIPDPAFSATDNPVVTIEMKNGQSIEIELYPKAAPNTVNNFISLVKKGFYDGTIFHRVIPGFMIQGGDPEGNGTGGPGYSITGEFLTNGVQNNLKHTRGVISMARGQEANTAGSQFFIMVDDADYLDGQYAAFGKVIKGMDTVDAIVKLPRDSSDLPEAGDSNIMSKVTVDTKGKTYEEPVKAEDK